MIGVLLDRYLRIVDGRERSKKEDADMIRERKQKSNQGEEKSNVKVLRGPESFDLPLEV